MKQPLADVLRYRNEDIVERFQETWDLPLDECRELFADTLRWLWLAVCADEQPEPVPLAISQSTKLIDEMWHTFILFTREYHEFCDTYFGRYVHHDPTTRTEYDRTIRDYERTPDVVMDSNKATFERQYEFIYDVLGEQILVKWYDLYLERYTDEFLRGIWRWSFSPYDTRVRASVRVGGHDAVAAT
jgi:hypothetical protein